MADDRQSEAAQGVERRGLVRGIVCAIGGALVTSSRSAGATNPQTSTSAEASGSSPSAGTAISRDSPADWSVLVNAGARTLQYQQSTAVDQGVVQTFAVSQRSRICQVDHPLRVLFRNDTNSDRMEVIFELGRVFANDNAAPLQYTAQILRGSTVVATQKIKHNHYARWRWQSAPRPVVGDLEQAYAAGLLPAKFRDLGAPLPRQTYSPMELAGIEPYMPGTGERPDLGLVTEWSAQYLANRSNLSTIIAQAEASGSMPWHFRDEHTGRMIDLSTYPNASIDDRGNPKPLIKVPLVNVRLEEAHMPNFLLVPYLLTGDPYYLEALQYQALWSYLSHPADQYRDYTGQTRAAAWTLRTTGLARTLTPAANGWLASQAQMQARLDAKRKAVEQFFAQKSPIHYSADLESGMLTAPWEHDFLGAVSCWLVLMGRTEFGPIAQWWWQAARARGMGDSGLPRAYATEYRYPVRALPGGPELTTWEQVFSAGRSLRGWKSTGNDYAFQDRAYLAYLGGAATLAARLGYVDASKVAAWVESQLGTRERSSKWALQ